MLIARELIGNFPKIKSGYNLELRTGYDLELRTGYYLELRVGYNIELTGLLLDIRYLPRTKGLTLPGTRILPRTREWTLPTTRRIWKSGYYL